MHKIINFLKTLRLILLWPLAILHLLAYRLSSQRPKIDADLNRFWQVHHGCKPAHRLWALYVELRGYAEFRSLFYYRIGRVRHLISWLLPKPQTHLGFDVPQGKIGGGLFIQHGFCTDLSARSIGENCWINQRVTLGYQGNDCPTIGNNVRIGTGAVIIGNVHVGDNVNIGANAIVVKDVPADVTVCSPAATIVKYHNKK